MTDTMDTVTESEPMKWWEEHPCPKWCEANATWPSWSHHDDGPSDQNHISESVSVPLSLHRSGRGGCIEGELHVQIWQNVRDVAPYVMFFDDDSTVELKLTPGETVLLIERLGGLIGALRP